MRRLLPAVLFIACFTPVTRAQNPSSNSHAKIELFGGYSSLVTTYSDFRFGGDLRVEAGDFGTKTGLEVSVIRNLNKYIGLEGDFSAHFKHFEFPGTLTLPCAQPPCPSSTQTIEVTPRLFNFLAGPEFKWRNHTRFSPFAYTLFGFALTETTLNTAGALANLSLRETETGFSMAHGSGLDVRVTDRFSLRYSMDYNAAFVAVGDSAGHQGLNGFRWSAGVLLHFRYS